jgi:hypothetical protein
MLVQVRILGTSSTGVLREFTMLDNVTLDRTIFFAHKNPY